MKNDENKLIHQVSYQNVYIGDHIFESEPNKSKYLDIKKDIQVGLHLGNIEEMKEQYVQEYCDGVPWNDKENDYE